jgi:glycosyltransferase involved in cell wall biosynthesis
LDRINVLYLIRTWALGGSHTIIRLLLNHLPEDRFNIITVPYDSPGTGNQDFVESVRREGKDVAPERIPWRSRGQWLPARKAVLKLIEKYDIHLIHAHDTHSNVLVGLGRGAFRCAAVASPYGWWEPKGAYRTRLYHALERQVALPNFERVITVSQDMKKKILKGRTREDRIRVIHTGLDLRLFDQGKSRQEVREELKIPGHAVVVGTVSRLFSEKGHRHLLDAAAKIIGASPQLYVLIVGTGDQREALEAQAQQLGIHRKVIFTGFYEDLPGALRAMDIFAQPSILHEGFPTAVLEAQAAGLPVVASNIGGTHETIRENETGILVPPGNDTALAQALRALVSEETRRKRMAAAARPFIASSFTLDNMVGQVAQTYEEALALYKRP